ncbi:MAG: hypothetical protein ACMG6H_06070 [Acidobacteriota bacterium]
MGGVKTATKTSLIVVVLALLACLLVLRSRPAKPVAASASDTSRGPSFEVNVVRPFSARPFFGLLPGSELRFDHTSRGAAIGSVGQDRLELRADGWDLFIETDGEGRVAPGTRLVFPIELGGRQVRLRCRPADQASGNLRTTTRAGSDNLDGNFLFELAACENADSGKAIEWPPAPLTVRGSFEGLPHGRR